MSRLPPDQPKELVSVSLFFVLPCAVCILFLLFPRASRACTSVVVGRNASSTGRVVVGHNEDDPGRLIVRHALVPSRRWDDGDVITAEERSARIPQPPRTLAFFWTQVRGERGLSNADGFYNERGVLIVSDSCLSSRLEDEPDLVGGGIGYALRRAVAERAESARSGVEIAAQLVGRYGYRSPGRGYVIADSKEAWILQLAGGKDYCGVRVHDDEAVFFPNHFTIRAGDLEGREHILSPELAEKALGRGWSAHEEGDALRGFDFAHSFQDPGSWKKDGNTYRHRHGIAAFRGPLLPEEAELPFAVIPERNVTPEDVKAVLRSHYEGTPDDIRSDFAGRSPHFTSVRRICTGGTVESMVALLSDDPLFTELLIARGRPCCDPYQPYWGGMTTLPKELSPIMEPRGAIDAHCAAEPELLDLSDAAWWQLFHEQTLADLLYEEIHPALSEWIARREEELSAIAPKIISEARALANNGDTDSARRLLTEESAALAGASAVRKAEFLAAYGPRALRPECDEIVKGDISGELTVFFQSPGVPVEDSFLMGQGGTPPQRWAAPLRGSLHFADGTWSLRFRVRELTETAVPCLADFWLAGRDEKGGVFAGRCVLKTLPPSEHQLFQGRCSL